MDLLLASVGFYTHTMLFLLRAYELRPGLMMHLAFLFDLSISLAICGLFCFHMGFRIVFPISMKNAIGILVGISIKFVTHFG